MVQLDSAICRLASERQPNSADEILTEVDDEAPVATRFYGDGSEAFRRAHTLVDLGREIRDVAADDDGLRPVVDRMRRKVPLRLGASRILVLPHEHVGIKDVGRLFLPPLVRRDQSTTAVR